MNTETTIVRDSIVGDNWILETMRNCPVQRKINDETGQPTGDIITGPVRLAFDNLFEAKADDNGNESFGAALLFPPNVDMTIFHEEFYKVCSTSFAQQWDGQQYQGVTSPFKMQDEKMKFGGFTAGCVYFNSSTKFQPPVTDIRYNPIVDKSKVYPGVWAICAVNPYPYEAKNKQGAIIKRGVSFGLQNVMIIGDDTKFGGGAKNNKDQFAGINVSAPIARPDVSQMGGNPNVPQNAGTPLPGYSAPAGAPVQQQAAPAGFTPPGTAGPASAPSNTQPAQPSAAPATSSPIDPYNL